MKYAFLFLASLGYSTLICAQTTTQATRQNLLKITLSNDSMSVLYRDKPVHTGSTIQALDSCLKRTIQSQDNLIIEIESPSDMDKEKIRALLAVLNRYKCPRLMTSSLVIQPSTLHPAVWQLDSVHP